MDRRLETPKVRDIISKNVIAFKPDFSQLDAIKNFNELRISSAPVINDNNEVIGIISETDCIKSLSNTLFYDENRNDTIDLVMTKDVAVANAEWDIFELENFLVFHNLKSAPVVDIDHHLVGFVTRRDILVALENLLINRLKYKNDIKKPVELNLQEQIKILLSRR